MLTFGTEKVIDRHSYSTGGMPLCIAQASHTGSPTPNQYLCGSIPSMRGEVPLVVTSGSKKVFLQKVHFQVSNMFTYWQPQEGY